MRKIKNMINKLMNKVRYNKIKKNINESSDTVFVDLGASSIKMAYKGELVSFRSSIRAVTDTNEVTVQKNAIQVNDEWYIVGESTVATGNYEYKYQKEYLNVLILFGLQLLKEKGIEVSTKLNVNVLLPYTQIHTKEKLSKKIDGTYKLSNNEISLKLNNISVEGESSSIYYKENYKSANKNLCVVNIGYSTTDIALYNSMNCREKVISINLGTNNLLSNYLIYTKAPTSSILNAWLVDSYQFTKSELESIKKVNKQFIKTIWNDVFNGVIRLANPQNTEVVFVGGGANLLIDEFKESIDKSYDVKVLSTIENVYSDLLGAMLISNEKVNVVKVEVEEVPQKEVKKKATRRRKNSKYNEFVILIEKGLNKDEIIEKLNIAEQTYKNYKVIWKKESAN